MCPDRLTVMHLMFRGLDGEFDRLLPGRGCELLQAVAQVGNLALVAGFASGVFAAFVVPDLVRFIVRRVRGRHAA